MSSSAIVSLRSVGKSFPNGTAALRGFSVDIARGDFVSFLGTSGCGKSTALRLIAGLAAPTAGEILWPNQPHQAAAQPSIGFVFQEPTLMPWATVAANVALPLALRGAPQAEIRARVADALGRVGLSAFTEAYPRQLSGGMKMRVSIARALVTGADLLLMDEPFAALDEITRFRLNADLLAVWQSLQKTVVFVTHSIFESVFLSRRVVVFTPGPGRVFADIAIEQPYPREDAFRTSAEFAALCRRVSEAMQAAQAQGGH